MPRTVTLEQLMVPGATLRVCFQDVEGRPNPNNKRIHVRALVDETYVVYRYWNKWRHCWVYEIQTIFFFRLLFKAGELRRA